eukprot:150253-Alexandrium_andersonii.AAC.1
MCPWGGCKLCVGRAFRAASARYALIVIGAICAGSGACVRTSARPKDAGCTRVDQHLPLNARACVRLRPRLR